MLIWRIKTKYLANTRQTVGWLSYMLWSMNAEYPTNDLFYSVFAADTKQSSTKTLVLNTVTDDQKGISDKRRTPTVQLTSSAVLDVVFEDNLQSCPWNIVLLIGQFFVRVPFIAWTSLKLPSFNGGCSVTEYLSYTLRTAIFPKETQLTLVRSMERKMHSFEVWDDASAPHSQRLKGSK